MNRKPITIYALLSGSTTSQARPRIQEGQATTRQARAAQSQEQPQEPKKKAQKAKRRAGRRL